MLDNYIFRCNIIQSVSQILNGFFIISRLLPLGKVLIIGGGIANFTNVAATFKGIVRALQEYQQKLMDGNVSIFVRRAGPNYQEGLRIMRELGKSVIIIICILICKPSLCSSRNINCLTR